MNEGAELFHKMVQSGEITLEEGETIKVISHSQGGAHAAGFAEQLLTYKDENGRSIFNIEVIYYITPHQGGDFSTPSGHGIKSFQFNHPGDAVAGKGEGLITTVNGGQYYGRIRNVTHYSESDIMGGPNQPPCEGPTGNRCGHNVTDNRRTIVDVLNEFCRKNPTKCRVIELVPSKAKKSE